MNSCPYCLSNNTVTTLKTKDYFLSQEDFSIHTCQNCKLTFTSPRPKLAELGKYYESDQYISHNDSKSGLLGIIYKQVRSYALYNKEKLIRKYTSGQNILDFGCGSGAFLNYIKTKGWSVSGVEFDDKTRNKVISETNIKIEKDTTSLPSNNFDIITTWHVMEHVYELKNTLDNFYNLLKPKGKLIIAVPNHKSPDAIYFGSYWAALDVPRHLYHFDVDSIKRITQDSKFKLLEIKPMIFDSYYISLISTKYKYGKINLLEGFLQGFISNIKTNKKIPNHSSLIYILEKNS